MTGLLCEFALHYRGRHRPEDALWWLDHPGSPGPSGAMPVQATLLAAADELREAGHADAAATTLSALAALIDADRVAALDALAKARAAR